MLLILVLSFLLAIISLNDFIGDLTLFGRIGIGTLVLALYLASLVAFFYLR